MKKEDMVKGGLYKFKGDSEIVMYIGYNWSGNGYWHQFELVGAQGVWSELLDSDLLLLEEVK